MQTDWKRGLTRLYVVVWAVWFLAVLLRVASLPPILWSANVATILFAGVIFPGLLLVGFRWALAGFAPRLPKAGGG